MAKSLIIISIILFSIYSCKSNLDADNKNQESISNDTVGLSLKRIEHLHVRKNVNSYDKSLVEYIAQKTNKVDSIRNVIYLLPFGNMKPEIEDLLKKELNYLKIFFQLEVKLLSSVSFEEIKKHGKIETRLVTDNDFGYYSKAKGGAENLREQIEAESFIASYSKDNIPEDAVAILGVTEHDIYNPKYNFLFGTSNSTKNMGLVSTFRLITYGERTKFNIRKVISKQIVNLFSIPNVKDYECLVNFHINKKELEEGEFKLSPGILEKLKYAVGFDYTKRFEELANFWEHENNPELADYYLKCVSLLKNK